MSIAFFALAIIAPALAMFAGHWFPWRKVLRRDLYPVESYIYGVAWILAVPLAALLYAGMWGYAALLAGAAASAGAATLGAYAVDHWTETEHKLLDAEDRVRYAEKGVSTKHLQAIEDHIAVELCGRDALVFLELKTRALHRRGHLDDEDLRIIQAEIDKARQAVDDKLHAARTARNGRKSIIND